MDMVDEELSSSNKLQIKLRFNHSKYSVSQKKFALIFVEDLWSSSQCRETSVTRGCAKRRTNQQQKHSFFLVAEVSHCIVWFPNPPTAGSQMGTLSTHCIACSTTTLKNSLKQSFLGQPLVKLGFPNYLSFSWSAQCPVDCHISAIAMQIFRSGAQLSKRKPGSDRYSDEHKYTKNPQGFVLLWSSNNGHWSVHIIYTVYGKL